MSLLQKKFPDVRRAKEPAELFCLIEQPEFAGSLSLVIADLRSPGMSPEEFANEFHARLPDVPVLLLGTPYQTEAARPAQCLVHLPAGASADEVLTIAGRLSQRRTLDRCTELDVEGAIS